MKFTLPQIRRIAVLLSVLLLAFGAGWFVRDRTLTIGRFSSSQTSISESEVDFSLFWKVWDKIENDYYDKSKIDREQMVLGAIKGMASSLGDPYTYFLPPEDQKRTEEDLSGRFEGVGIEIGFRGARLVVIAPLDNSPAEKAGVRAGDYVVGIKDKAKNKELGTLNISLIEAVEAIRGEAGTNVTLVLVREGVEQPLELEMTRASIDVPSVVLDFKGKNKDIAFLQLKRFGGKTDGEWDRAVDRIRSSGARGVVLDMRNNPGGYLNGALSVSSEFVRSGLVMYQEDGSGKRTEFPVGGKPKLESIPVVVLVNGGSASASEIVAGALKDNGRAKVLGERTFGKGTIQDARYVEGKDGAGVHITIAKWLTPAGTWIHEKGIDPDVEIKDDPATLDVDEQLEEAVKVLTS